MDLEEKESRKRVAFFCGIDRYRIFITEKRKKGTKTGVTITFGQRLERRIIGRSEEVVTHTLEKGALCLKNTVTYLQLFRTVRTFESKEGEFFQVQCVRSLNQKASEKEWLTSGLEEEWLSFSISITLTFAIRFEEKKASPEKRQ